MSFNQEIADLPQPILSVSQQHPRINRVLHLVFLELDAEATKPRDRSAKCRLNSFPGLRTIHVNGALRIRTVRLPKTEGIVGTCYTASSEVRSQLLKPPAGDPNVVEVKLEVGILESLVIPLLELNFIKLKTHLHYVIRMHPRTPFVVRFDKLHLRDPLMVWWELAILIKIEWGAIVPTNGDIFSCWSAQVKPDDVIVDFPLSD
jgi:hypothetical protein